MTSLSHDLLKESGVNFVGNVEGRDILEGSCDVIVCDGFIGNIILKFAESLKGFMETRVRKQISSNMFSKAGAILMGPFLRRMRRSFDYAEYGGAPSWYQWQLCHWARQVIFQGRLQCYQGGL